jgi:hypothetical protein
MAPDGIVEPVDIAANGLVGFLAGVEDGAPHGWLWGLLREAPGTVLDVGAGCRAFWPPTSSLLVKSL